MGTAAAGRRSKPPALKLLEGRGNGKDSGGRTVPATLPFTREAPPKPDLMSATASAMWDTVVADLRSLSILKPLDAYALEALCESYARWHDAKQQRLAAGMLAKNSQGVVISPLLRIEAEASKEFRSWCSEFGLTPAAEVKIAAAAEASDGDDVF